MKELLKQAEKTYHEHFDGEAWFGRCIFLSFYCERGTCDFCFRSVAKHQERHAKGARRSLASILAEAYIIKAFDWRIEFLTGGYGILDDEALLRTLKLVSEALDRKLWINLGEISTDSLEAFKPYVEGVVSSIETINPELHKKVCPDKPIGPYEDMITAAKKLGFRQGFTIIIGLGETKEDFSLLEIFIKKHGFDRITIYALRPVKGTPYEKGPSIEEMEWWIAKTRIAFPNIEIMVGTAEYRKEEIPLLFKAGANAITKLPATKLFNKPAAKEIETSIEATGRRWTSRLTHPAPEEAIDWESIERLELSNEEKASLKSTLKDYLKNMSRK